MSGLAGRSAGGQWTLEVLDAYEARTGMPASPEVARRYLRENIRYDLGPREHEALVRFYESAKRAGMIHGAQPVRFYG